MTYETNSNQPQFPEAGVVLGRNDLAPPYQLRLGTAAATLVSDGVLQLGDPKASFKGVSEADIDTQLGQYFLPTNSLVVEQNVLLLESGAKRILFESGMGSSELFGHGGGRLHESLRKAGIEPASIDAVVCSHPHPDHIGGICTDSGTPQFPNAAIYLAEEDFNFWTDEKLLGTRADVAVKIARQNLLPVRDRIIFFKDGQEFLPGVQAIFTPGHTKEHACFMLTSSKASLCLIGDLAHHHEISYMPWHVEQVSLARQGNAGDHANGILYFSANWSSDIVSWCSPQSGGRDKLAT